MSKPVVRVTPFCFWETNTIGLNVYKNDTMVFCADISIEEAETVINKLQSLVKKHKEMDKECKEFFAEQKRNQEKVKEIEHSNSIASSECWDEDWEVR